MLDLVIFTQYPNAYAPNRLKNEAIFKGLTFKVCDYSNLDLQNLPYAKSVILREPDANKNLYKLRDNILHHYFSNNSYILNSNSYLKWSVFDKITQHIEFKKVGIPHIEILKIKNGEKINLKYPFIAKNKLGSHGDSVYKITSKEDLDKVLQKHKLEDLLFQEFQTAGFDLRVIVLGGKVLGIMKRTPKLGNFLSNYSQGGTVARYKDTGYKDIKTIALASAQCFNLDYCGVDIMRGNDGKWKVLEVNRACQFKGFEKATGVNVAKSILSYLYE